MVKVSKVLYSNKEANKLLQDECERVAAKGGNFTIIHEYASSWFSIYAIDYSNLEKSFDK